MGDLISVIVPVYNVEPYLARCVESLLAQSYEYIEIILIDDGSSDRSGAICDQYAKNDSRIIAFHQEYKGVSEARNKGMELANGQYICFLDSDDEAADTYVEKLYTTLVAYNLDIAQCCLIRIRNGKRIQELPVKDGVKIYNGIEMQWKTFNRDRYYSMCLCGKLFKRELFNGLQFPAGRINEDESLIYLLMYRAKRIGVIDDYLYYYHFNIESITEKPFSIHRLDSFYMLEEKYAFYRSKGLDDLANKTASEYFSQMGVVFLHQFRDKEEERLVFEKAKSIYIDDRTTMLEKATLPISKWIFMKLSYLSLGFIKLFGLLMKKTLLLKGKLVK